MNVDPPPDRRTVRKAQLAQLRTLIAALAKSNRSYSPALTAAGVDQNVASLDQFTARMPVTTKQQLVDNQRDHPPYGTNLTFEVDRYSRFSQTSATTGVPLRWLDTPQSWSWMLDNWAQVYDACGVTDTDRIFFAFSFGPFLGFWTAFEAAARLGCLCIPSGGMSSAARLAAIVDNQATVLCCTPTYAIHLGQVASQEHIDLNRSNVRSIIVAGEPGGSVDATRSMIQSFWPGARVYDHHGMTEVGPVSFQCPAQPGTLHVIEPAYLAEVVDPDSFADNPIGSGPVAPGETGELILTTLGRTACPLLRYRTGDIVRLGVDERCACGRSLTRLEGGILGRADDMVLVRGVNVFPSGVDQVVRARRGIAEYRVEVQDGDGLTELTIRIEADPDHGDIQTLCRQIEHDLYDAFQIRVPVTAVDHLPRFEMKAKRWVFRRPGS